MNLIYLFCVFLCAFQQCLGGKHLNFYIRYNSSPYSEFQCGNEVHIKENDKIALRVTSENYVLFDAWCHNIKNEARYFNLTINTKLKQFNRNLYYQGKFACIDEIPSEEEYDGDFACVFPVDKKVNRENYGHKVNVPGEIKYFKCIMKFRVEHKINESSQNPSSANERPIPNENPNLVAVSENPEDDLEKGNKNRDILIFAGIIGGSICIIAVLVITMWRTCRKSKTDLKQRTSVTYENFNNDQPFPPGKKLENIYISPDDSLTPYAVSNPGPNHYAEPIKQNLDDLYSKPVKKDDPKTSKDDFSSPYSHILPKTTKNDDFEVTYAEIEVASSSDRTVSGSDSHYASVIHQIRENPSPTTNNRIKDKEKADYINVFTNEPYVNSKSTEDLVEPAYCQIHQT